MNSATATHGPFGPARCALLVIDDQPAADPRIDAHLADWRDAYTLAANIRPLWADPTATARGHVTVPTTGERLPLPDLTHRRFKPTDAFNPTGATCDPDRSLVDAGVISPSRVTNLTFADLVQRSRCDQVHVIGTSTDAAMGGVRMTWSSRCRLTCLHVALEHQTVAPTGGGPERPWTDRSPNRSLQATFDHGLHIDEDTNLVSGHTPVEHLTFVASWATGMSLARDALSTYAHTHNEAGFKEGHSLGWTEGAVDGHDTGWAERDRELQDQQA